MSKPEYALQDFIVKNVPSCVQTTSVGAVLEMFELGECDRVVVVSQKQCPIGVLKLQRLMPQLLSSSRNKVSLDIQQPLQDLSIALMEPIGKLPVVMSVEQFRVYLSSPDYQTNAGFDWTLVDSDGKYIGLLDCPRLLEFLALSLPPMGSWTENRVTQWVNDALVQLLERLPWPVILQISTGEVVTQNQAWRQQFEGLSEPEAVRQEVEGHCQSGNQLSTCICALPLPNDQERVWQFVKIPLQAEGRKKAEGRRQKDEFDSSIHPLLLTPDLCLVVAIDITEQQQLASELAAKNADLIQLNRLKDEFLACISHELKTPITAVLGLSNLLQEQALGQLNERQARYAQLIHQSSRQLMTVVNDILDLTRMETGQLKLTLEPVQIRKVCDRAIEQARAIQSKTSQVATAGEPLAESAVDHRFTLLIEPGLDIIVADELRLRQMLANLLSNAFKFTAADGEVGLQVSHWEGWITFTVWDTGIGIPEQKQHLIFQKFQQLENPLTRQFEGTGLGLVLTRALVRLHGGDISFFSKEGKGSSFTLLLPPSPPQQGRWGDGEIGEGNSLSACPVVPLSLWISTPTTYNQRNRLVLVVEAAPRFIEDLTEQLTNLGFRVVIARSGTEALEKTRRLQPGAVFLNPVLPLLSGWDVLTLLKSDAATRQIPVIVTATLAEKEQAFASRADEFLSLPVQQQVLQQILTRFFANSPVSQSAATDQPLTIMRLSQEPGIILDSDSWLLNSGLLHQQHHYRLLEADGLEQAELLARVWQPDVVLLDGAISEPLAYLEQLSHYSSLASLPLVILDPATTQAANQIPRLSVFPCLIPTEKLASDTLLSMVQLAVGKPWQPNILIVDVATLPDLQAVRCKQVKAKDSEKQSLLLTPGSSLSLRSEWFQALIQYLETAGFIGAISRSWAEMQQQIQQQSVDLLLISLGNCRLDPSIGTALKALSQEQDLPPILMLSQEFHHHEEGNREDFITTPQEDLIESVENLGAIATQILPPSISIEELLDHIHQTLAPPRRGNS